MATESIIQQVVPQDLPTATPAFAGWTLAGIAVYGTFLAACVALAALWHELRCLRRSAEAVLHRLTEDRAAARGEAHR